MRTLSLCAELSKVRIDKYLADEVEILSRSKIKDLILSKDILVDGNQVKPSFMLSGGETIQIIIPNIQPIEKFNQIEFFFLTSIKRINNKGKVIKFNITKL